MAYCASAPSWEQKFSPAFSSTRTEAGLAGSTPATTSATPGQAERVLHQCAGGLGGVPAPPSGLHDPVADLDATVLRWAEDPDPAHDQPG